MRFGGWIAGFLVVVFPALGLSEVTLRSPLELSGRDDALAELYGHVFEVPLADGRTLQRLFDELADEELRFRRMVEGHVTALAVRRYSNGSIDVDIAVDASQIAHRLQQVRKASPALGRRLGQNIGITVIGDRFYATGLAHPEPTRLVVTGESAVSTQPAPAGPLGWHHVARGDRDLTVAAAKAQALTRLFNKVRRLPIDADRTVGSLLRLVPGRTAEFRATLSGAAVYDVKFDPAQICVAGVEIPTEVAATFLSPAVKRGRLGGEVLSATGYASPPGPRSLAASVLPDWYHQTVTAVGKSGRMAAEGANPEEARTAAIVDAKCKLAEAIDRLSWPEGGVVGGQIKNAPGLAADLTVYFAGTRTLAAQKDSTEVTITVEIPLRRLYHLLASSAE